LDTVIIVEGKRDRERLQPLVNKGVHIVCTFGIPTPDRLQDIARLAEAAEVAIFTDNDKVGKRIRGMLRDEFPDALHLHTKAEYGGVESTPVEHLLQILERHELAAVKAESGHPRRE
jgi:toprim domain protein